MGVLYDKLFMIAAEVDDIRYSANMQSNHTLAMRCANIIEDIQVIAIEAGCPEAAQAIDALHRQSPDATNEV